MKKKSFYKIVIVLLVFVSLILTTYNPLTNIELKADCSAVNGVTLNENSNKRFSDDNPRNMHTIISFSNSFESTSSFIKSPTPLELITYSDKVSIKAINSPSEGTEYFRGASITVEGVLRSAAPNDYWDGETVEIYYNLTKDEFEIDPDLYRSSEHFLGTAITNSQGEFSFTISTSLSSADITSKTGEITIFSWFDGNPEKNRGAGSAGSTTVIVYGIVKLTVTKDVTNPNLPYSFTTKVLFDNNTAVSLADSTNYNLNITWEDAGTHTNANYSFTSNMHTYTNTAPATIQSVYYRAYYDTTQLGLSYFFTNTEKNTLLYLTASDQTTENIYINAYYIIETGLTNDDVEIPLDSTITLFANVTNSTGLVDADYNITVRFYNGNTLYNTTVVKTNSTGAIELFHIVSKDNIADITITNAFYIEFDADTDEFGGSTINPDSLGSTLSVFINQSIIVLNNPDVFYTEGLGITYNIYLVDQYGRNASSADVQVVFPGLATRTLTTGANGVTRTSTIPTYVDKTQNKTISISVLEKDGGTYIYYVGNGGTVTNETIFNMYYELTLTLKGPYDLDITDGEDVSYFNNTFNNYFQTGEYNLTVIDEFGRNPVGAPFSINFEGELISGFVTSDVNVISLTINATELLDLNAPADLSLSASAGAASNVYTIEQTISIYGPDLTAPTITSELLNPNPLTTTVPIYEVEIRVWASDEGTGIRSIVVFYTILDENRISVLSDSINLNLQAAGYYNGSLPSNQTYAKGYLQYYIVATDYAGHGLDESGNRQADGSFWYDPDYGLDTTFYNASNPNEYRIGDYAPPDPQQVANIVQSTDPKNPYVNITVYLNDTTRYTGVENVTLYISRLKQGEITWENLTEVLMTHIPGTNQYFYTLNGTYNYEYQWYYEAFDKAIPNPNVYRSQIYNYSAIDSTPPSVSQITLSSDDDPLFYNSTFIISANIVDSLNDVIVVLLLFEYWNSSSVIFEGEFIMYYQGNDIYAYSISLLTYQNMTTGYGGYSIQYTIYAEDTFGNNNTSSLRSQSVSYPTPPRQDPLGETEGNINVIVWLGISGVVLIIAVLFLWFNRHSISVFTQKQLLQMKIKDYLQAILDDIRRDGAEGKYKRGLLKTWGVLEGIGREYYNIARTRYQTTWEYVKLLGRRSDLDTQLLNVVRIYFEKARYGIEDISEDDFNAGLRALLKIVEQIETGEIKIET